MNSGAGIEVAPIASTIHRRATAGECATLDVRETDRIVRLRVELVEMDLVDVVGASVAFHLEHVDVPGPTFSNEVRALAVVASCGIAAVEGVGAIDVARGVKAVCFSTCTG